MTDFPRTRLPDYGVDLGPYTRTRVGPARIGVFDLMLLPFSLTILDVRTTDHTVEVLANVLDRDTGRPLSIRFQQHISNLFELDPRQRACCIRNALMEVVSHEVDEILRWAAGGHHVRDPHAPPEFTVQFDGTNGKIT